VEQFLRDCKIASIYEGTNGIQALDLVGRKIAMKRGRLFMNAVKFSREMVARFKKNYRMREMIEIYEEAAESLVQVTKFFGLKGMTDEFHVPILYAKPYLDLFGDVAIGLNFLWQAYIADRKLQEIFADHNAKDEKAQRALLESNRSAAFYAGKIASAKFWMTQVLTQASGKARAIMLSDKSPLEIPETGFALV
jgi:hypothetical protein